MRPMSSLNSKGIAAIISIGPKLGHSVARKFTYEGYTVAILARDLAKLSRLAAGRRDRPRSQGPGVRHPHRLLRPQVRARGLRGRALTRPRRGARVQHVRDPRVPPHQFHGHHHRLLLTLPCRLRRRGFPLRPASILPQTPVLVIPGMVERIRGTVIFTGSSASLSGSAGYCELCCGKFALRGLAQCLTREFQTSGIHVARVVIIGVVGASRSSRGDADADLSMDPDAIAQSYWHIHKQDKSAWTHEINLHGPSLGF